MYQAEVFETSSAIFLLKDKNLYLKDSNGLYSSGMQWLISDPKPKYNGDIYMLKVIVTGLVMWMMNAFGLEVSNL